MREVQDVPRLPIAEEPPQDLQLLIATEPWTRTFAQNLLSLFGPEPAAQAHFSETAPGVFWSDVFVERGLPWRRFLQSGAYHAVALALIWAVSRFLALQPHVTVATSFHHAEVIYYSPSEYLPPLDTRTANSDGSRKPDPEYSAQPIISLPREAGNRSQTIVAPPNVSLRNEIPLPNVVALTNANENLRMPIAPAPVIPAAQISRIAPRMQRSVVAPPPQVRDELRKILSSAPAAVIAPPPELQSEASHRMGDINLARSSVIAPAPLLPVDAQHALMARTSTLLNATSAQVVGPPPSLVASGQARSRENLIALSLRPTVGAPPRPPAGNRRGTFAVTPEGHRGASGAAGTSLTENSAASAGTGDSNKDGAAGKGGKPNLPSGLYVGKATNPAAVVGENSAKNSGAYSVNPHLIGNVRPPRFPEHKPTNDGEVTLSQEERAVFGSRRFYSLCLNMPNLNSAGGSWIIRFAALQPEAGSSVTKFGELSSPVARRKVDPAYPLELMRQNLSGTVILYGVIRADGTVGNVRVLRSVDERLDQYATDAIAKWKFDPATKNGAPVDVEATFWIPFRPTKTGSNF